MTTRIAIVVVLAHAACSGPGGPGSGGDDDPGNPSADAPMGGGKDASEATSGSRLKARTLVGDDGTRQFVGWRDTQRGEDCAFMVAADGVERCLPVESDESASYSLNGFTFWSDSACTSSVFFRTRGLCPTPGRYWRRYDRLTPLCGVPVKATIWQLGTPMAGTATFYRKSSTTPCEPVTAGPNSTYEFFEATAVPPAMFVAATIEVEP